MRIRCASCHGEFWIDLETAGGSVVRVPCTACSSDYKLHVPDDRTRFQARLAGRALALVRLEKIDLPSAYSVLLGVMRLEEVPDLEAVCAALPQPEARESAPASSPASSRASAPAPRAMPQPVLVAALARTDAVPPPATGPAAGSVAREASRGIRFDPRFQAAVEEGRLTALQAMQRGMRSQYVQMTMTRHGLPQALAEEVTDNRMSLLEALRQWDLETHPPDAAPVREAASGPRWDTLALLAVVAISVGVAVFTIRTRIPPDGPAPSGTARIWSVQGAEVLVDNYGRPLRVSAMEAASVLRAYCAVDAKHRYESVELVPADDRAGGDMLGLLRRTGRKDELLSILVRDEQASHRWVAGDGIAPLEPQPAPPSVAARIQSR